VNDAIESVCNELDEDNVIEWRLDGDTGCYVTYPQGGSHVKRTWYEARNKCLHLNGDLATNKVTSASVTVDMLEKDTKYWIGLQRDPLMKTLSGTFDDK